MMWNGYGPGGWGMALMMISQILFWGLVIAGVFYLVPKMINRDGANSPERTLAERYARGEIDEEEYRHRLATLRKA
jgi:putative membrane protein